nr:glycine-rich cell wall structural protein-like [Aegilops tauschii subsp. strangulata]
MCSLSDELAAASKPLGEGKLISFIVAGLDMEYQLIISTLDVRTEPITIDALFSLVANFDRRVEMFHGNGASGFKSSANATSRGCSGGNKGGYHNQSGGRSGGYPGGGSGSGGHRAGGGYGAGGGAYAAGGGGYSNGGGPGGGYH